MSVYLQNPITGFAQPLQQRPTDGALTIPAAKTASAAPTSDRLLDEYARISWHSLERSEGQYDFSTIDNALVPCGASTQQLCLPAGVTLSLRIIAVNPQIALNTNTSGVGAAKIYSDAPDYLLSQKHGWLMPVNPKNAEQGSYFIPDWNDPEILQGIRNLLLALGTRYGQDPRIGWIDIGFYGSWGEWHTKGFPNYPDGIPYKSTDAYFAVNTSAYLAAKGLTGAYQAGSGISKAQIVDSHADAFPTKQLVMLTDDGEGLCHALHAYEPQRIGLRRDSLGSPAWSYKFPDSLDGCSSPQDKQLILNRWRKAPFVVEAVGQGANVQEACATFSKGADGTFLLRSQAADFHITSVKNGGLCSQPWAELGSDEQASFLGLLSQTGARLAPSKVILMVRPGPGGRRTLDLATQWTNQGDAPPYKDYKVEYSVWRGPAGLEGSKQLFSYISTANLRDVAPASELIIKNKLVLPVSLPGGFYHLGIKLPSADGYAPPLQLALPATGSVYELGQFAIAKDIDNDNLSFNGAHVTSKEKQQSRHGHGQPRQLPGL